jgi:predicted MFS family arabinose efflux permease
MESASRISAPNSFAPFKEKVFRSLWIGSFISNIGTWMQNIGVSWIAATMTTSPLTIALIPVAASLPALLCSYPAGVISDYTDRRKLLIYLQLLLFITLVILSVLTQIHLLNINVLIIFSFIVGIGSAFSVPVWQAITPEIVSSQNMKAAIALNGVNFNLARAIGPALGGVLLVYGGVQSIFLFNALSFLALVAGLYNWHNQPQVVKKQTYQEAFIEGLRAVRSSAPCKGLLIRTISFTAFVSIIFAILPHLSRYEWHQTSGQYTCLWIGLGIGALFGSVIYGKITSAFLSYKIVWGSCVLVGFSILTLSFTMNAILIYCLMFIIGIGWIWATSTLNILAQLYAPKEFKGRFLATNVTVFQGSLAISSVFWGFLSRELNIINVFFIAGLAMVICATALVFFPLREPDEMPDNKVACTAPIIISAGK